MKILAVLISSLLFVVLFAACEQQDQQHTEKHEAKAVVAPAKPMAMMMRAIYDQSAEMRKWVEAGKPLDSTQFRFLEFHQLEPTDSTVLVEVFYKHNQDFKAAFEDLMQAGVADKEKYNTLLTKCVSCHEDFCPGPIKRINKLKLAS